MRTSWKVGRLIPFLALLLAGCGLSDFHEGRCWWGDTTLSTTCQLGAVSVVTDGGGIYCGAVKANLDAGWTAVRATAAERAAIEQHLTVTVLTRVECLDPRIYSSDEGACVYAWSRWTVYESGPACHMESEITFNFRGTAFAHELLHCVKAYRMGFEIPPAPEADVLGNCLHATWSPTEWDETRQADEDSYCVTPC